MVMQTSRMVDIQPIVSSRCRTGAICLLHTIGGHRSESRKVVYVADEFCSLETINLVVCDELGT